MPGAVSTPLVHTVEIAGVDRDHPQVSGLATFADHAVSPEKAADKILAGVVRNRFLIYTSATSARCTCSNALRGGHIASQCDD